MDVSTPSLDHVLLQHVGVATNSARLLANISMNGKCITLSSAVIRCHPLSSAVIRCHPLSSAVIRCHLLSSAIIRYHCALYLLCAFTGLVRREVIKQGCVALVLDALVRHAGSSDLQHYGLRFLDNIAMEGECWIQETLCRPAHSWLVDARLQLQHPSLRKVVHGAILAFQQDVDVLIAACRLINRLAYDGT